MDYTQETADLIERQCQNVERSDFTLDKPLSEELILKTYDLFNLPRPKNVKWCVDIFDEDFQKSAWSAGSAWSARSAWIAWSARSAGSAGSAWSAWSAGGARSAGSARSARSAGSAGSALDYDFDWYVMEYEYVRNPDKEYPVNDNDRTYLDYCELLMQAKEAGLGYRVEWEDTLYLVSTPLVKINSLNQFHSDNSPAIRWKEGSEFYYLNGVNFPKDLFDKVISGEMPFQDILAIEDIDQRTQAMRFGNVQEFVKHAGGKLLDSQEKYRPDKGIVNYRLYKIPKGKIFTIDAYYILYDDPSTGKEYMSGVEPCKTVAEGMGWKFGIKPKDWQELIPLVTEA